MVYLANRTRCQGSCRVIVFARASGGFRAAVWLRVRLAGRENPLPRAYPTLLRASCPPPAFPAWPPPAFPHPSALSPHKFPKRI